MTKLPTCKKDPMFPAGSPFPAGHRFRQFSLSGSFPFPACLRFRQFSFPGKSPFPAVLRSRQVSVSGSSPFTACHRSRQFSGRSPPFPADPQAARATRQQRTHYTTLHNVRVQDVPDQLGDGGGAHQPPEEGALHDGAGDSVELGRQQQ